jgi:hypothetical protein
MPTNIKAAWNTSNLEGYVSKYKRALLGITREIVEVKFMNDAQISLNFQ